MWYKIPTHVAQLYKGWKVDIYKASNWNKTLQVNITPGVELNLEALKDLSYSEKVKKLADLEAKKRPYSHTFIVKERYLGILEFAEPWKKANQEAKSYIDQLGEFDYKKFSSNQH